MKSNTNPLHVLRSRFIFINLIIVFSTSLFFSFSVVTRRPEKCGPPDTIACSAIFFEAVGTLKMHPARDTASQPHDISANGLKVVGESCADEPYEPNDGVGADHCAEAFGWTRPCRRQPFFPMYTHLIPPKPPAAGIMGFGYLPGANAVHTESYAFGISPDGQVVVGYNTYSPTYYSKAVVFLPAGILPLVTLDSNTLAYDISQPRANSPQLKNQLSGRIIIGYTTTTGGEPQKTAGARAVYWDRPDHIVLLPVPEKLPNDSAIISSEATCISDDGNVIGGNLYYKDSYDGYHFNGVPCAWTRNTSDSSLKYKITLLNDLPNGDNNAKVLHISGNGKVLVGWGNEISNGEPCFLYHYQACKWTYASLSSQWSQPESLENLSGTSASSANGTNVDGSTIVGVCFNLSGTCDDPTFVNVASVWKQHNTGVATVHRLATLLGDNVPDDWNLYYPLRVSANGKIITGYGYHKGSTGELAWVVGIP